jgi:thiol-disulfide isomerase/thioredoxin
VGGKRYVKSGRSPAASNRIFIVGVVVAALALIVAIVVLRPAARDTPPLPSAARSQLASSAGDLKPAPDIDIVMYQGESVVAANQIRLSRLWGRGKPVVLNFFAGLCPPCRTEMPDFQRLYDERAKDSFLLIALDIGPFIGLGSREEGRALLRELKISFPAGTTFNASELGAYRILGMPTTVFITPAGKIFKKHTGLLTRAQMDALVGELLKASGLQ